MRCLCATFLSAALLSACGSSQPAGQASNLLPAVDAFRPSGSGLQPFNVPAADFPTAVATLPTGIRRNLISATVVLTGGATEGALYMRRQNEWTAVQYPGASSTAIYGPEQVGGTYRVVGSYQNTGLPYDNGFIYDSSTKTYKTINPPSDFCAPKACNYTIAHSVYGNRAYMVVGNFNAVTPKQTDSIDSYPAAGHAFLYDGLSGIFRNIDVKGAKSTTAYGIWVDGKTIAIAGGFADDKGTHAYLRDLGSSAIMVFDHPHSKITHFEGITGAGGPGNYDLVGDYSGQHGLYGFVLPIRHWKARTPIALGKLTANSIYGGTAIGVYKNDGKQSGFIDSGW